MIFQKLMDTVLQGIPAMCNFVTGTNDSDHMQNLATVLQRLQDVGFRWKKEKCSFLQDAVEYLGHKIDAEGLYACLEKVAAFVNAPQPHNISKMRAFLGMVNYYRKFIPNLSTLVQPLNSLLQPNKPWNWSEECRKEFQEAKQAVVSTQVLAHYDPKLPLTLAGDASAYGIGAVIKNIMPDGSEKPIAFASRSLSSSERNFAQIEKEALSRCEEIRPIPLWPEIPLGHRSQTSSLILGQKKGVPL